MCVNKKFYIVILTTKNKNIKNSIFVEKLFLINMYWFGTFILLKELYLIIIITEIVMLCSSEPLSAKIDDYNLDNNIIESHPLNEGFILPVDNHKNSPPITSTSDNSTVAKHTSTSYDISSTTCKTITVLEIINPTSAIGDDGEINSFLKIDDRELVNTEVTIDGSGESMFKSNNYFLKNILLFFYSN